MSILVFIDDLVPSEAEHALAEALGTKKFRTLRYSAYPVEAHTGAVALDPSRIPDGYVAWKEKIVANEEDGGAEEDAPQDQSGPKEDATNTALPAWMQAGGKDAPLRGHMAD